MNRPDKLSIFLRDCVVPLSVGLYPNEQQAPQRVAITIEAETTLTHRFDDPREKTVGRIVSYETLYTFVTQDLPQMGHIFLLESVAEHIIAFCLRDARLHSVHVRLEKRDILPGAVVGIELTRTRQEPAV